MRVAVFGAGYVGCVTTACLASFGHQVWLVEISPDKLESLRNGRLPVFEPGLEEAFAPHVKSGQIVSTDSALDAVAQTELALICVGTPGHSGGAVNTTQVRNVLHEIGQSIAGKPSPYVIAIRSTITGPQIHEEVIPLLKSAIGDRFGNDIALAIYPEFLREGSSIEDFLHPPFTVVGTEHALAEEQLRKLNEIVDAPFHVVSPGTASLLKYACNAFHASKVAFANEIANLESLFGADADAVMKIFCEDKSLNISPAYLRPGYAFGGSCLPKDLRALNWVASTTGLDTPLLSSVLQSNEAIVRRTVESILEMDVRNIVLAGLSFKTKTDDLRESPLVELAERLIGKGYQLQIYDPDVDVQSLLGQNLQYAQQHIQHLASYLSDDLARSLERAQLVIVGKPYATAEVLMENCQKGTKVLDLIRCLPASLPSLSVLRLGANYTQVDSFT